MIKDILVCLEGSASSERATDLAIEIARELSARLMGLAIVDEPNIRAGAATGIGGASFKQHRDEVLLEHAHKKAADWLLLFEARCRDAGIAARTLELRGRPAPKILEELQPHDMTLDRTRCELPLRDQGRGRRDARQHPAPRGQAGDRRARASRRRAGPTCWSLTTEARPSNRALRAFAESGLASGRKVHVASVQDDGEEAWEMASRGVELLKTLSVAAKPRSVVSALPIADAILETRARLGAGHAGHRRLHAIAAVGDHLGLGHAHAAGEVSRPDLPASLIATGPDGSRAPSSSRALTALAWRHRP